MFYESFLKDNELVTEDVGPDDVRMWIEPFDQDAKERSVIVEGFHSGVKSDILKLLFEDFDGTGGGPIDYIRMGGPGTATITFKEREVAERVAQRQQTVCTIPVVVRRPLTTQRQVLDKPEVSRTVKVTGLDTDILNKTILKLFFKNKESSCGGPVANLDVHEKEGTAFVTFHSPEDAQRVADKGQYSLGGCEFTTAIVPAIPSTTGPQETDQARKDDITEETPKPKQPEVGDIARGETTQTPTPSDADRHPGPRPVVTPGQQQPKVTIQKPQQTSTAMSLRCRMALQRAHEPLVRDLDLLPAIDFLYARSILTLKESQRIRAKQGVYEQRRALLELLPSKSQQAYEDLSQHLSKDQPWLLESLTKSFDSFTEAELAEAEKEEAQHHAPQELTHSLKHNMQDRLDEWKTALEEGVSDQDRQGELLPYIKQPCDVIKGHQRQKVLNTFEVVENSQPGDRLVIYGEAGMGKTTLLKQLARSWIEGENEKLQEKFSYVFLIPLRRVGQGSLLNIICDELGLVPASSMEDLKKSLGLCEHRVLYLLDSYEELRGDVVRSKRTDIDDLITGKIFPKSTVVVTSRPGSKLKKLEDQTTAHLQDLPENEVRPIIQHHFGGDEYAVNKVQSSFQAMAYLQKPINLALFIFIITHNKHLTLSYTQAELFSLVLQYIMLAFAKKKKLEEFTPQTGTYIGNRDIPKYARLLFSVIAKKCYEQRKENNVTLHIKETDDLKDFLDFGLFTAGPGTNTVLLPDRLFIEYFAAAHLAENPDVWAALFKDIEEESERESPRPRLSAVVRAMGLENVLRFVVALSPQPQLEQVCRQVGSLFVLERKKIEDCDNYQLVNSDYYSELLRDCCDESGKRLLAAALLDAPVRDVTDRDWEEDRSQCHVLFQYLDNEQRVTFLKKVHSISLSVKESTLSCTGGNKRLGIGDRFVVAIVYCHDCIIKADELYISGETGRRLDLPASVFTRMSGVRLLSLYNCTLCKGLPDYMSDIDISPTVLHSSPCQTNSSLERVKLFWVEGLEHCDVITSRQCQLVMLDCDDVRVSSLKTWFPRVSELELGLGTTVVYETEEELASWLSTIPTVRGGLDLAPQHEGESVSLCHLLNILAEKELGDLWLWRYTFLFDVRDTSATVKQNNTLSTLELWDCKGDVDLGQLLEVCSRQCPQLKEVWVVNSNLVFDDEKVESVKQLPGLQKFWLWGSAVHTPAGRRLSKQEAEQLLHRLCPSARIYFGFIP